MKRLTLAVLLVFSVAMLSACNGQKAPDQELAAAQASLDQAKQANIDPATNPDLKKAQDAVAAAKTEIDKQTKKFSFMRDYKGAVAMLSDAKAAADKAVSDAKAAMEKAAADKAAAEKAAADKAAAAKAAKKGKRKK